jgi:hypothetical protein
MKPATKKIIPLIILGIIASTQSKAEPVAVVEDVNFVSDHIQPMDFLDAETTFELKSSESIVIGYFSSCLRESIKGGNVTIGQHQSTVIDGEINRKTLECVGGDKVAGSAVNQTAAAVVFRTKKSKNAATAYKTIYSLSPIVRIVSDYAQLRVTRANGNGNPQNIAIENGMADFRKSRVQLKRNKIYTFSYGGRSMTVKVSPRAKLEVPLLSRIILF